MDPFQQFQQMQQDQQFHQQIHEGMRQNMESVSKLNRWTMEMGNSFPQTSSSSSDNDGCPLALFIGLLFLGGTAAAVIVALSSLHV